MIIKNFELLIKEIRKIGNLLIKNKKNREWSEILDIKKNTTAADYKVDKLLKIAYQENLLTYLIKIITKKYGLSCRRMS